MSGKLIEFEKAEKRIRSKALANEKEFPLIDHLEERLADADRMTERMVQEASFKSHIAEAVIERYRQAIGKKRITEQLQNNLEDFMEMPADTMVHSRRRVIPIMIDDVEGTEYAAGILRTNEKGKPPEFTPLIVRKRGKQAWERFNDKGKWVPTSAVIPELSEEEMSIMEKNDAGSELMRMIVVGAGDDATHERIMEKYREEYDLKHIKSELQGLVTFTWTRDGRIAVVPLDNGHTGIAVTTSDGDYEIRQFISGHYRSLLAQNKEIREKIMAHDNVILRTKKVNVVKDILFEHITSRKGYEKAITVPLSAQKSVCITGETTEDLLRSFTQQTQEEELTNDEWTSANMFTTLLLKCLEKAG